MDLLSIRLFVFQLGFISLIGLCEHKIHTFVRVRKMKETQKQKT
jgi:hypothetical protein